MDTSNTSATFTKNNQSGLFELNYLPHQLRETGLDESAGRTEQTEPTRRKTDAPSKPVVRTDVQSTTVKTETVKDAHGARTTTTKTVTAPVAPKAQKMPLPSLFAIVAVSGGAIFFILMTLIVIGTIVTSQLGSQYDAQFRALRLLCVLFPVGAVWAGLVFAFKSSLFAYVFRQFVRPEMR